MGAVDSVIYLARANFLTESSTKSKVYLRGLPKKVLEKIGDFSGNFLGISIAFERYQNVSNIKLLILLSNFYPNIIHFKFKKSIICTRILIVNIGKRNHVALC